MSMLCFSFTNVATDKVLEVQGEYNITDGTAVDQWDFNGGFNQLWIPADVGNGLCKIENASRYLSVAANVIANGTPIIIWHYEGGTNQQWNLVNLGKDALDHDLVVIAWALDQRKVVQVPSGTGNGVQAVIWDNNGELNQIWRLIVREAHTPRYA